MLRKGYVLAILVIGVSIISILSISAEESLIPSWIKTTAGFWVNDQVSDSEFISALQFLVKEGILVIPQEGTTSQPSSIVTTPSPTPTPFPSPISEKYQPNLEAFNVEGSSITVLVSVVNQAGKQIPINGEMRIQILDFDDKEIFNQKKYVVTGNFESYTNDISGNKAYGFGWTIQFGKVKSSLSEESLYNDGLGTMIISYKESGQLYENEIQLSHLPINEGYFNEKTGFIDNFVIDKALDVGPFYVRVKDVGRYFGEDAEKGDAQKEYFRINLNTKFKYIEGVKFILDEIFIMDEKNRLYSSDETSIENFVNVFMGQSYEYEGGNGYILFEEIPSDVSDIKLTLKITKVEGDVSDTHYEDEIEISLR